MNCRIKMMDLFLLHDLNIQFRKKGSFFESDEKREEESFLLFSLEYEWEKTLFGKSFFLHAMRWEKKGLLDSPLI